MQDVQVEEKQSTRKYTGAKSSAQADRKFKAKLDTNWNKVIGDFRARSHPELSFYEKGNQRNFKQQGTSSTTESG